MASGFAASASSAAATTSVGAIPRAPARSRKVRKILHLEARAQRLLARYESALAKATGAMAQARALLDDANGIEHALTGTQLGELRRARAEALGIDTASNAPSPIHSSTTTSP